MKNTKKYTPVNWSTLSINDTCEVLDNMRVPINSEERERIKGNIPYYGANGVQGFINKYIFDEDLILLAEDGGYFDEYNNRPIAYKISGKSWVNNHAHILKAKKGYNQDYIFYSLVHKNILPFIKGGTRAKLNQNELKEISFQIPKLYKEQEKIAEILITLDNTINKTEQIIEKYKKIKEGIISDLFTRGIGIEEKLRLTYDEKPELYKKSKLGYIPIEWEIKTLKDLCSEPIRDFGSFSSTKLIDFLEDGIPFIKSEMIKENYIDWDEVSYISEDVHLLLNKSHVKKDTILFSKIGSALGKAVVYDGDRGICNSNAASAKITIDNSKADNYFICYYLNFELTQVRLKNKIVSLLPRINLGDLSSLLVAVPPLLEQEQIKKIIDSQIELIRKETIKLNKYKNIKKGLVNDLISGNVSIKL